MHLALETRVRVLELPHRPGTLTIHPRHRTGFSNQLFGTSQLIRDRMEIRTLPCPPLPPFPDDCTWLPCIEPIRCALSREFVRYGTHAQQTAVIRMTLLFMERLVWPFEDHNTAKPELGHVPEKAPDCGDQESASKEIRTLPCPSRFLTVEPGRVERFSHELSQFS